MRRSNECLILEPSEMIVIDYPDVQLMKGTQERGGGPVMNNVGRVLVYGQEDVMNMGPNRPSPQGAELSHRRYHSDGSNGDKLPPELQNVQSVLQRSEHFLRSGGDQQFKRSSRASDTSSAYSGSDVMQSSIDDQDMDFVGLVETQVDSDDEEGYVEAPESLIVRDTVRECLEKDAADRTEDDIETLLEFMQHFPAFANMTLATRRALCAVMVFAVVERAGTVVMNDGEELDSWSVILNGHVEIQRKDGTIEHLHMGDSFGITPTMEKLYHKGIMRTKVDDCQFVCIAQADYYRILHQGEENTRRHEEAGEVVLVTEHRVLDGGNRKGHIVIRGTPARLMSHLVEEHSAVDPTYVEDFLLTYRTFLKSPSEVANKLLTWFTDPQLRDRVTRVVLLWVNNHFNDFETDSHMSDFLEKFEHLLDNAKMGGQLRLLNIACAAKARSRNVVLTKATREEILHFSVLGGMERGCGIFISKVEKNSKAHEAGLKRGDQILEVNNHDFQNISHNRALEILRGTTHLAITVKSNLLGYSRFKEMLQTPENSPGHSPKKDQIARLQPDPKQRLSAPLIQVDGVSQPLINQKPPLAADKVGQTRDKSFMSTGHRAKIRKALMKFNFMPGPRNVSSDPQLNQFDDNSSMGSHMRKGSSSSNNSSPIHTPHLSASNPDLSSLAHDDDGRNDYPEHVLKIYKSDQTCKYFLVHRETTAREVVMLALKEFSITDPSSNYSLCEVSAEQDGLIKQKRLPDQMSGLPDRINLNCRYYLKNNLSTEPLVADDMSGELMKESNVSFLQLNSSEVAAQLTLRDFQYFMDIESTEYIDDLFERPSKYGFKELQQFSELVNSEMFWVVSETCSEQNIVKRSKIIKQFIKIARHCKEVKNFNSMFAIVSGLGHGSVSRLRSTWDKVPAKYIKIFEDLQDLMDPSRNMSKYRNLLNSEMVQPPIIPFFPVVKKDLTFINLGNDSKVDGLVNFEKLRMIAKEVRHICGMSSARYDAETMMLGAVSQSAFATLSPNGNAGMATLRRKRRNSAIPNPKKMYEEAQMVRRVKSYLHNMKVTEDEVKLNEMSVQCEPPANVGLRKRDPSPSPNLTEVRIPQNLGPKFGAEEPEAVRKLMGLANNVKPHNQKKHPVVHIPTPPLHTAHHQKPPVSPRNARSLQAVNLCSESNSVVSLNHIRKSATSSSVGSCESASPTNSIGSHPQIETDSGHNSVSSSNYDSHSTSSVGSANTPPSQKRAPTASSSSLAAAASSSSRSSTSSSSSLSSTSSQPSRPPLPPYHVVVQNSAFQHYIQQQYTSNSSNSQQQRSGSSTNRPPLPDYHMATKMAQQARRKYQQQQQQTHHQLTRSHSLEGVLSYYGQTEHDDVVLGDGVRGVYRRRGSGTEESGDQSHGPGHPPPVPPRYPRKQKPPL